MSVLPNAGVGKDDFGWCSGKSVGKNTSFCYFHGNCDYDGIFVVNGVAWGKDSGP